jgi:hypothetical protein
VDSKIYYYGGFGAGVFYSIGDIIGGIITPDYSYVRNAVSELIQSGAEDRVFLSSFLFVHALMIVLFSVGLLAHYPYKKSKSVFIGGILMLAVGASHALSSSVFPQDPVGAEATFPGIMHLVLVGITVLCIFAIMPLLGLGLRRYIEWKSYRVFTFLCLAAIVVSGISSPIVIGQGIEVVGLTERITGYTFYVWMAVLAYMLIKAQPEPARPES